jgi:integrase
MTGDLVPYNMPIIDDVMGTVLKRLHSDRSKAEYRSDARTFAAYLISLGITDVTVINYAHMVDYQDYLKVNAATGKERSPRRINRMFTVARQVLDVQVRMGYILRNPAEGIDDLSISDRSSPHIALGDNQAAQLLEVIDTTSKRGKQEYAIMSILIRTGLRRAECANLNIGSVGMDSEHYILRVKGKGGYDDIVKLPADVKRYIQEWLDASGRTDLTLESPLFVSFRRGDHPTKERINPKWIERMVLKCSGKIGLRFTPHSLRATFITLAMEHGATLVQTQDAARHQDPRQTDKYRRRRGNLDDNAVDKLAFLSRKV